MSNQWPLIVACGLLALAAAFGTYQHERAVQVASLRVVQTTNSAARTPVEKIDAPAPVASAAATPTIPAQAVTQPAAVQPPAVAQPSAPLAVQTPPPAAPVTTPIVPAQPTAPAIAAPATVVPAAARRDGKSIVLSALKEEIKAAAQVAPMDLANGGFAVMLEGARLEAIAPPNWSVSIYNINRNAPEAETPAFTLLLTTTAKSLGIDLTQKPVESANGKSYLRSTSKLGSVSLTRDPANGNSCVIRPIQQWVAPAPAKQPEGAPAVIQQPAPVQPQVRPAQPAQPATPATPPKAPTDANF